MRKRVGKKREIVRWDKVKRGESETSNQIGWWVNWMHV